MITIINFALFLIAPNVMAAAAAEGQGSKAIPSVPDYFKELKDDMTKLTWAHAVNNKSLLQKALADSGIMMLEADVVLGTLVGTTEVIPIMAHPPASVSDLSLKQFLDEVCAAQASEKKGIKLDFKSTNAFTESLKVVSGVRDKLSFPVWLNADILRGPIGSETTPVDADQFLAASVKDFPDATLSLGWTTKYGPDVTGAYTESQLNAMEAAIARNKVSQPVTLAVRAGIVARSAPGIASLVDKIDSFQKNNSTTLTIWMSTDTDPVDIAELKNLILTIGKSRTFLDVPEAIRVQLNLDSSSGKTPVSGVFGPFVAVLTSVSTLFTNALKMFD